ncbi:FadR/GntR family transcriptional regulator [Nocardioides sp. 31GB23]|uniref:FadR/GntR family transcriptional regulator n=1 Tax=Nocardioides sp. 31GB23 TaxID=3156065 RepID=UPI0032B00D37
MTRPQRRGGAALAPRGAKLSQYVAAEIVRDVVAQGLNAGDRLPTEAAMLEEFDVGRASLREALRILESYGLISIKQGLGGGPVVNAIHPEDLARTLLFYFHSTGATVSEIAEARCVLEPASARLAAERQDPDQMAELRNVMAREQQASMADDEYMRLSNEFHYAVSGLSGNRVLDLLGRALRTVYTTRIFGGGILPSEARHTSREVHRKIGEAILAGDGALAEKAMGEHLKEISDLQFAKTPEVMDQVVVWEV